MSTQYNSQGKTYNGITPISSDYDLPRTGQSRKTQDSAPLNDLAGFTELHAALDSLSRVHVFQKQRWELHLHVWKALDGKGGKRGKKDQRKKYCKISVTENIKTVCQWMCYMFG